MEIKDLEKLIKTSEQTNLQLKQQVNHALDVAKDIIALANINGGYLIIGIEDKNHKIMGLDAEELHKTNQLISNATKNNIQPSIFVETVNVILENNRIVVVVIVPRGEVVYYDNKSDVWIKSGSDKRKATPDDILVLMQDKNKTNALDYSVDSVSSINDIDLARLKDYLKETKNINLPDNEKEIQTILNNQKFMKKNEVTVLGALLFAKPRQYLLPKYGIKAISFLGTSSSSSKYRDSEDIYGVLDDLYKNGLAFLKRNLKKVQGDKGFNTQGDLEINEEILEELLMNALIHRDYFVEAHIKLFIFDDRVEIISPGSLPRGLTVEEAKNGVSRPRNPSLVSYAEHNTNLPYRGAGTGIKRALEIDEDIEISSNIHQVTCIIRRSIDHFEEVTPEVGTKSALSRHQVEMLKYCTEERGIGEIMKIVQRSDRTKFRNQLLNPLLQEGFMKMTIPDKPNSSKQKYTITDLGRALLKDKTF